VGHDNYIFAVLPTSPLKHAFFLFPSPSTSGLHDYSIALTIRDFTDTFLTHKFDVFACINIDDIIQQQQQQQRQSASLVKKSKR
jgi:hypothetical protein